MAALGLLILFYAAARLNGLALFLSPFAAAYVVFYSMPSILPGCATSFWGGL